MTTRTYQKIDIVNKVLTIDKDLNNNEVTEAIIDFGSDEVTANIVALAGRVNALKVVISGLKLNGYIDIAKNDKDNELKYSGECNIISQEEYTAPIHVGKGTKLKIYCESEHTDTNKNLLKCDFSVDGKKAAGIGGNFNFSGGEDAGNIIISGAGMVNATSNMGAGIGGGMGEDSYNGTGGAGGIITIEGNAKVDASSKDGAGIGGGLGVSSSTGTGGTGGTITIGEMAKVNASSVYGAGIGGGRGFGYTNGTGGAGGTITIVGMGIVEAKSNNGDGIGGGNSRQGNKGNQGDILIANPNIVNNATIVSLTKRLIYNNGYAYSNRTIGLIEVDGSDNEINKYMTGTDENGQLKYYYHNETLPEDRKFKLTNSYLTYTCKTEVIDNVDFQQLKFSCESSLKRGVDFFI